MAMSEEEVYHLWAMTGEGGHYFHAQGSCPTLLVAQVVLQKIKYHEKKCYLLLSLHWVMDYLVILDIAYKMTNKDTGKWLKN